MSRWQVLILTAAISVICVRGSTPTPRYSSKTGYEASFEPGTNEKAQRSRTWQTIASDIGENSSIAGCQPIGVYSVYRHGVRYASDGDIEDYNAILTRMKTTGINGQFSYLLDIADNAYPVSLEGELHPAGFEEMKSLGARMKMRLPELFTGEGLAGFDFQGTYRQRTIDSAQGFISGLLGSDATCNVAGKSDVRDTLSCTSVNDTETVFIDHAKKGHDTLLKFYESCKNFITSVDDNDTAKIEGKKFGEGPELTSVYEAVAAKLAPRGSSAPWNMTKDDLEVMHHMCGYETAYYGGSPWCNLFTNNESLVVEYWLDLDQYWTEGYGHPINYEMACPLVDNVVKYMLYFTKETGKIKGSFKFAHVSTLQPLLTILGLYRDMPKLYADNYNISINRAWRSGRIAPMSGNIGFNVFQCPSNEYRVLVLHNELPIKVGSCDKFFCPFDVVKSHLEASSNGCRWDKLCGSAASRPRVFELIILFSCVFSLVLVGPL